MPYEQNVFVNCPFDEEYLPLLRPLLFTILYLRLEPRIALERADSGELRLTKIVELFEHPLNYLLHHQINLSKLDTRFCNDEVGEIPAMPRPGNVALLPVKVACRDVAETLDCV